MARSTERVARSCGELVHEAAPWYGWLWAPYLAFGAGEHARYPMTFRFEELEIWREARGLSSLVYDITDRFPLIENFGLTSQLTRSANGIGLLIAEGAGLGTRALFAHRLRLALGEASEVAAASALSLDRSYITVEQQRRVYADVEMLARKISRFRRRLI